MASFCTLGRTLGWIIGTLAATLALGGCYAEGNVGPRPVYGGGNGGYVQTTTASPGYVGGTVTPAPTVYGQPAAPAYNNTPSCPPCQQGAPEVCDGCDNNCNGVVDEGC